MKAIMVLLASLLVSPVAAEVKDRSAQGFTLENAEVVSAPADAAWRALVEQVGQWWPADHTWWGKAGNLSIAPVAGGCFCEIDGDRQAEHMRVVFADPGRLLRMVGGLGPLQGMGLSGVLEFRLSADEGGGTRIVMFYRAGGYLPEDPAGFVDIVDRVQAAQLAALARHLNGEDA